MRIVLSVTFFVCLAWFACSPVHYFIIGPEVARLPPHLRMDNGASEADCTSFVNDWNRTFPTSRAFCERVPRWQHWSNLVLNLFHQIGEYRTTKPHVNQKA